MCRLCVFFVFFFKQKTAYEMRISDWSSDVCSSDLVPAFLQRLHGDDVLDGARRVEEVDAVEPALVAGGDGDLLRWNVLRLDQMLLQHLDRHLLVPLDRKSTRLNSRH